jgi:hypothetical protein
MPDDLYRSSMAFQLLQFSSCMEFLLTPGRSLLRLGSAAALPGERGAGVRKESL